MPGRGEVDLRLIADGRSKFRLSRTAWTTARQQQKPDFVGDKGARERGILAWGFSTYGSRPSRAGSVAALAILGCSPGRTILEIVMLTLSLTAGRPQREPGHVGDGCAAAAGHWDSQYKSTAVPTHPGVASSHSILYSDVRPSSTCSSHRFPEVQLRPQSA